MKRVLIFACLLSVTNVFSQASGKIFTTDIVNFWTAFDSIQQANDYAQKIDFINRLYIDKGTKGFKAFMKARDYNDTLYVKLIEQYPKFWQSIRANTLSVIHKQTELNGAVTRLKLLYPSLKDAEMYFTIGGLRSGGTVSGNMVLVGAEIATGNAQTDVSEFKNDWLKNVFAAQSLDNIISLNIHEYIHTQQTGDKNRVLNQCIKEGACDFIAELAIGQSLQTKYLSYGKEHAAEISNQFKEEMFSDNFSNWLYNGSKRGESADLGYYVGYTICKAYYDQATDKSKAVKDIIELNYDNDKAVENFLAASKFFKEKINKAELVKAYNAKLPFIVKLEPFNNGFSDVSADTKELRITFSKEMQPGHFSINLSSKGEAAFPITKVKGFENNDKTIVFLLDLKPQKEYEFIVTNRGFVSKDGYPLKEQEYPVKFTTK